MDDKIQKIVDLLNEIEDGGEFLPCLDGDLQFLRLHEGRYPIGGGHQIYRDDETGYWDVFSG